MSDERARPRQLGRGLEALFGSDDPREPRARPAREGGGLRNVPIARLVPNPHQPRRRFDDGALKELAESIREKGVLQPLIVRPAADRPDTPDSSDMYEIVAGERRWRAAQQARLHEIPVIVRSFTDEEVLAVALIENIQRNELTPIEEATAYARLSRDFDKTQEEVAGLVGKSRSHVANMMRLLTLPEDVRDMLADGRLSMGHARAILLASDPAALAKRIVDEGLSVRAVEKLGQDARGGAKSRPRARSPNPAKDADTRALERELANILGVNVDIEFDGAGGRLTLKYSSLEQLDDLVDRLIDTYHARHGGGHGGGPGGGRGGGSGGGPEDGPGERFAAGGAEDFDDDFADDLADDFASDPGGIPPGSILHTPREEPPWDTAERHRPKTRPMQPDPDNPDTATGERPEED